MAKLEVARGEPVEFVRSFITNTGIVPALDIPSGVDFVDFRAFTTDQDNPALAVDFFVYTFQGRLNIEVEIAARYNQPTQISEICRIVRRNLDVLIADLPVTTERRPIDYSIPAAVRSRLM
ncbi:phthiocerol/phthiodiolone dimycocerosyl transferase family protein [Nocardia transvalensis]|uniref:phthiocerol/phthiodiolone dimycocerosyl transferase family protein n=1 Tax=Nocardia transvalensis TaxID=37333 RepID=UPI0018934DAF|nr:hypothetical protein [Nocardia transvalensis]MBF6331095.1 hypothetical protein [Nocardia transvalensis]